ncbi:radical SAM protein [Candidatus Altiarchaeota archaeon]
MRKIVSTAFLSKRIGSLPEGCQLCVRGEKLVLFVTGLCPRRCWYCPISEKKKNRDVVYANERPIKFRRDVLEEARLMEARGAGFTGGDPLTRLDRTLDYIRLLKKEFGPGFHIHLYTSGIGASRKVLGRLFKAGLDEIRFHPAKKDWRKIKDALTFDWSVGVEIPTLPGEIERTKSFISYIDDLGVNFINLNELEVSYTNVDNIERRGYEPMDESFSVNGVEKAAEELLSFCQMETSLRVHYCTIALKDGFQIGNRLKRRARNVAREFDVVTNEGLLVRGAIYLQEFSPSYGYERKIESLSSQKRIRLIERLRGITERLKTEFGIPEEFLRVDDRKIRILTRADITEKIADELKKLKLKPAIVEEYPTWDALTVDLEHI